MKIESGKYYRTRDGRKVGPMEHYSGGQDGFSFCCGGSTYNSYGGYYSLGASVHDLIAEWTEEPEQGTLKELNVQPGDVVECLSDELAFGSLTVGERYVSQSINLIVDDDGEEFPWTVATFRIISRASKSTTPAPDVATPPSPVRTVTRKEIVPGVYGFVRVHDPGSKYVRINIDAAMSVADLTQAIETLTEIRDALVNP